MRILVEALRDTKTDTARWHQFKLQYNIKESQLRESKQEEM